MTATGQSRAKFNAVVHGDDGPWLTLVHGGLASSATWSPVVRGLDDARTLTYDLRGYGPLAPPETGFTVTDHARDLIAIWDELDVDRSWVLGFSFGGMVAQALATVVPERVAGLVLVSTSAGLDDAGRAAFLQRAEAIRAGDGESELRAHVARAFSRRFREEQPEATAEYERHVLSHDPLAAAATFEAIGRFDGVPSLGDIGCPTLVVVGAEDTNMGAEQGAVLEKGIPQSELVVVPESGHTVHVEAPAPFVRLVLDFIRNER